MSRETLHILDGGSLLHRSFHGAHAGTRRGSAAPAALAGLRTLEAMVARLVSSQVSRRMVVALDSSPSWRHEVYPAYKATRPTAAPELVTHLERGSLLLGALGLPLVKVKNFEADDLIAHLAPKATARGWDVVIHASDKDLLQLVQDGAPDRPEVSVYDDRTSKTLHALDVVEEYGVGPDLLHEWLAMVGDPGDNVPGVAGVGEKTATTLLHEHGCIDELLRLNPKVRGKYPFAGTPENRQAIALSVMLVELPGKVVPDITADFDWFTVAKADAKLVQQLMTPDGVDVDDLIERSAIMEHDGGLRRHEADEQAVRSLTR